MSRHAENFPPSSSARWLACPGSIALIKSMGPLPDDSNIHSETGTAAHKLLEMCLKPKSKAEPSDFLGKKILGIKVDAHMVRGVSTAYEIIQPRTIDADSWGSEQWVDIKETGEGGTVDAFTARLSLHKKRWHLDVYDYKNGKHAVSAERNSQMMLYGLGILSKLGLRDQDTIVTLHIIGPNFFGASEALSSWETTAKALWAWADERVKPAVKAHNDGAAKCVPGPHCKATRCPALSRCEANARAGAKQARLDFADFIKPRASMAKLKPAQATARAKLLSNEEVSGMLRAAEYLEPMFEAARKQAMLLLAKNPKALKDWKLVASKPNRCWRNPADVVKALKALGYDEDEYMKRSLCGLGDVTKLLDVKKRESFMNRHTIVPQGRPVLAAASDPRNALSNAKLDFADDLIDRED